MQSVEEFIESYFLERAALQRAVFEYTAPFRKKFLKNSERPLAEKRGSHQITRIEISDDTAKVITSEVPYEGARAWHRRYRLERCGDSWLICGKDWECLLCDGSGVFRQSTCDRCGGSGWKDHGQKDI